MLQTTKILYNPELEFLLKENGEQAEIYSLLHEMAFVHYRSISDYINIPLIIMTAIIGFLTGIGLSYPHINLILGAGGVMVSIMKSVVAYKKLSERSENHRICSLQFGQISKEIKVELSLRRQDRQDVGQLLHLVKVKLKNLIEVAELIDGFIVRRFRRKYPDACSTVTRRSLPSIFTGVSPIEVKHSDDHKVYFDQKYQAETEMGQRETRREQIREHQRNMIVNALRQDHDLQSKRMSLEGDVEVIRIQNDHELATGQVIADHKLQTEQLKIDHDLAVHRMKMSFERHRREMERESATETDKEQRILSRSPPSHTGRMNLVQSSTYNSMDGRDSSTQPDSMDDSLAPSRPLSTVTDHALVTSLQDSTLVVRT